MWNKLSYHRKVYATIVVFFILLILAYNLVFFKTIALFSEIKNKQEKLNWLKNKEKEIPLLQAQMNLINKAYSSSDSSSIRNQLTAFISDFSEKNDCIVTEIPENKYYEASQLNIQTNKFEVNGRFKNLLILLQEIEIQYNYKAKVVSAKFYSVKDVQSKQTRLYLSIITQTFRQTSES